MQPWDRDKAICEIIEEVRAESPGAWHPLVIEHPVTGRKALYASRGFVTAVEGMTHEKCREFLDELFAFVEDPARVRTHEWMPDDFVLWDNRSLIHHAGPLPADQKNISYRVTVMDGRPFYVGHSS